MKVIPYIDYIDPFISDPSNSYFSDNKIKIDNGHIVLKITLDFGSHKRWAQYEAPLQSNSDGTDELRQCFQKFLDNRYSDYGMIFFALKDDTFESIEFDYSLIPKQIRPIVQDFFDKLGEKELRLIPYTIRQHVKHKQENSN